MIYQYYYYEFTVDHSPGKTTDELDDSKNVIYICEVSFVTFFHNLLHEICDPGVSYLRGINKFWVNTKCPTFRNLTAQDATTHHHSGALLNFPMLVLPQHASDNFVYESL